VEDTPRSTLVGDASVLIDIADANEAVLALIAQHDARVVIPTPVLAEVDGLDELKCAALGLEVVEPTLDQLREAAIPHPALSFADRVCMIVARDAGGTAWTNDGALGDECDALGVARMRGLRPLITLVEAGALAIEVAVGTVDLIGANNPFITPPIVAEFHRLAGDAHRKRLGEG
jgi:predicted nucleic acid-binding protein